MNPGAMLAGIRFDYQAFTYDGSNNVLTVTCKAGGASGAIVAVITYTYSGANMLTATLSNAVFTS